MLCAGFILWSVSLRNPSVRVFMCPLSISFSISQALQSLVAKSIYFPPLLTHIPSVSRAHQEDHFKRDLEVAWAWYHDGALGEQVTLLHYRMAFTLGLYLRYAEAEREVRVPGYGAQKCLTSFIHSFVPSSFHHSVNIPWIPISTLRWCAKYCGYSIDLNRHSFYQKVVHGLIELVPAGMHAL